MIQIINNNKHILPLTALQEDKKCWWDCLHGSRQL